MWVLGLCLALAAIEPATHFALRYALPASLSFTGLHIADDSGFLPALRMFSEHFFSPYVTALHEEGPNDPQIYGAPVFWLLGVLGVPAFVLGIDSFLWLGILNGAGLFFYLWAVYRFLRTVWPRQANLAFLIFALGGGLGGILYLITAALGFHDAPWFETFFHRYARYELIEGPFLAPWLLGQRHYYTAPLALGFSALTIWHKHRARLCVKRHLPAVLLLFAATYWNARLGPLFWLVMLCWCLTAADEPLKDRVRLAALYALPVLAAVALVSWQMNLNPATKAGTFMLLRRSIWIGSLASATSWQAIVAWPVLRRALSDQPSPARLLAWAAAGYLLCLAVLYAGYQTYWGNWLAGGDTSAAIALSDWALPGAAVGALLALRSRSAVTPDARVRDSHWPLMWLLALCAAGVSALGQGRLLVMMPERCMVLMGVPLAVLAAQGLELLRGQRPKLATGLVGAIVACGVCSLAVSSLCFQAPVGHTPGKGAFQWLHTEVMTPNEAALIDLIDSGIVLAPASSPPLYGDIVVARRPGVRTVFGQGTFAIGDRDMAALAGEVSRFFNPATAGKERAAFLGRYQVDFILCPETTPVASEAIYRIRAMNGVEETAAIGSATLFRVRRTIDSITPSE